MEPVEPWRPGGMRGPTAGACASSSIGGGAGGRAKQGEARDRWIGGHGGDRHGVQREAAAGREARTGNGKPDQPGATRREQQRPGARPGSFYYLPELIKSTCSIRLLRQERAAAGAAADTAPWHFCSCAQPGRGREWAGGGRRPRGYDHGRLCMRRARPVWELAPSPLRPR